MLLLIALSSFATVVVGLLAVTRRSPDPVRLRAQSLGGTSVSPEAPAEGSFARRVLHPLARVLIQAMPHRLVRRIEHMLVGAGEPIDLGSFALIWLVSAVIGVVLGSLLGTRPLLLLTALGIWLPFFWLRRRVHARRSRIRNELPDAIDMLVTCVESGLGLDAALVRVGEATEGPLGEEITRTLREMAVGRARHEALLELGRRGGVTDLDSFIRPIVQAERSGVSIGPALRVQADAMRVRRRQRAEEAARKIPTKIAIIGAATFLPTIMIICFAPAVSVVIEAFGELA